MMNENFAPDLTVERNSHVKELAELLFMIFIYVTDIAKGITVYEVDRFHRLMSNLDWTGQEDLRAALSSLRESYSTLWRKYESKSLVINLNTISAQLTNTWKAFNKDGEGLRAALKDFIVKIGQSSSPSLAKIGLAVPVGAKAAARKQVEALLVPRLTPLIPNGDGEPLTRQSPPVSPASLIWPAANLLQPKNNAWGDGRISVKCVNIVQETHDVKTYIFVPEPIQLIQYIPGQFVTLELMIEDKLIRRSYTISSSPSRPYAFSITVKRIPNGLVSNWLYENMREGVEIHLSGPHGRFSCLEHPADKLLFLGGGSGITPIMSMLRWLADSHTQCDVVVINNVRSPADIIFEREFHRLAGQFAGRLKLDVVPSLVPKGHWWNGPVGAMSDDLLELFVPDLEERETFVCGPAPYMDLIRSTLEQRGYPMHRFHQERFGPAAPAARVSNEATASSVVPLTPRVNTQNSTLGLKAGPDLTLLEFKDAPAALPAANKRSAANKMSIVFTKSGKSVDADPARTLLEIAEDHGIPLSSSCRAGACGTCKVRKLHGSLTMGDQCALSAAEMEEGYILPCISWAQGEVALEV